MPPTRTSRSSPAGCRSRTIDPTTSCVQARTVIVVVPSTKSTGTGTSSIHSIAAGIRPPAGVSTTGSELYNELGEEDIDHLGTVEDGLDPTGDGLLERRLAFGRDERRRRLLGEQFENLGAHARLDDLGAGDAVGGSPVLEHEPERDLQVAAAAAVGQVDHEGLEGDESAGRQRHLDRGSGDRTA